MFCRCEDFISLVAHALVRAASTLVSTPGGMSHWLRLGCSVGRTPSSARAPLVALLRASSTLAPPERRRQPGLAAPQLLRSIGILARKFVDGLQVFDDAVAGLDFDFFRGVEPHLHEFVIEI